MTTRLSWLTAPLAAVALAILAESATADVIITKTDTIIAKVTRVDSSTVRIRYSNGFVTDLRRQDVLSIEYDGNQTMWWEMDAEGDSLGLGGTAAGVIIEIATAESVKADSTPRQLRPATLIVEPRRASTWFEAAAEPLLAVPLLRPCGSLDAAYRRGRLFAQVTAHATTFGARARVAIGPSGVWHHPTRNSTVTYDVFVGGELILVNREVFMVPNIGGNVVVRKNRPRGFVFREGFEMDWMSFAQVVANLLFLDFARPTNHASFGGHMLFGLALSEQLDLTAGPTVQLSIGDDESVAFLGIGPRLTVRF